MVYFEVNYYLLEDYSFEGTLRTLELASHFHKTCLKYKSIIDENGTIFDTVQSQNNKGQRKEVFLWQVFTENR